MSYTVTPADLAKAVSYYEKYGVATEWMMQLGGSAAEAVFAEMKMSAKCKGIEAAITDEYVFFENGKRYDYYQLIYNSDRFSDKDKANDFLVKNKLHPV